ncbi:MAG: AAA family ATPase [Kangiella sp.]|nr:AAA family ATPase [Kangiella sp.]
MVKTLWEVFKAAKDEQVTAQLFNRALKIPNAGFATLTECLFYTFPEKYLPINKVTKVWFEHNDITSPSNWDEYVNTLKYIRSNFSSDFAQISFDAWKFSQKSFSAKAAIKFLESRYAEGYIYKSRGISIFKTQLGKLIAIEPKLLSAKVYLQEDPFDEFDDVKVRLLSDKENTNVFSDFKSINLDKLGYLVDIESEDELSNICDWYDEYEGENVEEAYSSYDNHAKSRIDCRVLNTILYGPPGTGKTYITTEAAVELADPVWFYDLFERKLGDGEYRQQLKKKYDSLVEEQRIAFTTFHQSFSYEDFVEGIRASTSKDRSGVQYDVEDGVFKIIADNARTATTSKIDSQIADNPTIWKVSLGKGESDLKDYCFDNDEIRIGWPLAGNLANEDRTPEQDAYFNSRSSSTRSTFSCFVEQMKIGDIVLSLKDQNSVDGVGVITSDYEYIPGGDECSDHYINRRKVKWLFKNIELNILKLNNQIKLVQKTVYKLDRFDWDSLLAELSKRGYSVESPSKDKPNYVLIIDEINRGNISRIFGELITLLEKDKRIGGSDERSVILPYSKKPFSVPTNLYVLGTMNTADKSLAQLDLALRRRFEFKEMLPDPELLRDINVYGVNIAELLTIMNQRIEILLDRDHLIGHSYFWSLKDLKTDEEMLDELGVIFQNKIIPLLQEYFFADWERIGWVLNDIDKKHKLDRFIHLSEDLENEKLSKIFSDKVVSEVSDRRYKINLEAFKRITAYKYIIEKHSTKEREEA